MAKVFVSYSRRDFETDGKRPSGPILTTALDYLEAETQAILGTKDRIFWRDTEGLRWGDAWRPTLQNELLQADFLLVLLSPNWLESEVCVEEFRIFRSRAPHATGRILPILLRDVSADSSSGSGKAVGIVEELELWQFADWRMLGQLEPSGIAVLCEDHARELAHRIKCIRDTGATDYAFQDRSQTRPADPYPRATARAHSPRQANAAHRTGDGKLKVIIGAGLAVLVAGVLAIAALSPNCSISVTNGLASCFGIKARDITITD